ncbi:protein tramtrack, beta isoform isoform X3 [Nilaparvata lugens]|uniref:protein tramtrack, beta isoform isoform X3 n=1 Tax=Nilaparvata lugens TaxID=108931 RepID=UPI00193D07D1|nr:protein tramtrack, beta isoform isoform X3 [Nilaparvata lugens]
MLLKGGDSPAAQWCNVECTAQIRARSGGRIPFCEANTTRRRPTVTLIAKLATVIIDASNFKAGECITAPNSSDKMAADQQFCLRWNNHQSTLIQVFDTLLASEQLVDCTLAAEGQYLKAHKVVLSACSPYLELLLAQHYEKHPIVILKDVKFQELKSMMDYMYRGEVNISQDQLSTFLKAAESLQIKGLTDSGEDSRDVGSTKRVDGAAQGARKAAAATGAAAASSGSNRASPAVGGTGLTIEPRPASPHHRDASLSPTPRKRRRARRPSQGDAPDSHNDTSNSCDLPPASALAPPEQHIETEHINNRLQNSNNMELIKEKVEPTPELMIEPKTEYMDENNEDSVEDLTLDDDDDLDMNRSGMDMGRPGPSHGDSNQGFATSWHMQGDRSGTDEVFMAAQEAVGAAHRDSQAGFDFLDISNSIPLYQLEYSIEHEDGVIIEHSSNTDGEINAITQWSDGNSLGVSMEEILDIIPEEALENTVDIGPDPNPAVDFDIKPVLRSMKMASPPLPNRLQRGRPKYIVRKSPGKNRLPTSGRTPKTTSRKHPVLTPSSTSSRKTTGPTSKNSRVKYSRKIPAITTKENPVPSPIKKPIISPRKTIVTTSGRKNSQSTEETFLCVQCGRTYKYSNSLVRHRKFECGTEPKFPCPHCEHKSRYKNLLRNHILVAHPELA